MEDRAKFRRWMIGRGWSKTTINKTLSGLAYLENQYDLDLDSLKDMSPEDRMDYLTDFLAEWIEKGREPRTLNNYVTYLNRYLAFMRSPVKLKKYKEYPKEFIWAPTDEEMEALLSVEWLDPGVTARNRTMLLVLFATGIRLHELTSLDIDDIFEDRIIVRHGKGDKYREVFISPSVHQRIMHYVHYYRRRSHKTALFTTTHGRISDAYARKIFREAGHRAGVPRFHAHAARHWRALKWLEEDVSLETIRKLLGHSTLSTTQMYLRARKEQDVITELKKKDHVFWSEQKGTDSENLKEVHV